MSFEEFSLFYAQTFLRVVDRESVDRDVVVMVAGMFSIKTMIECLPVHPYNGCLSQMIDSVLVEAECSFA